MLANCLSMIVERQRSVSENTGFQRKVLFWFWMLPRTECTVELDSLDFLSELRVRVDFDRCEDFETAIWLVVRPNSSNWYILHRVCKMCSLSRLPWLHTVSVSPYHWAQGSPISAPLSPQSSISISNWIWTTPTLELGLKDFRAARSQLLRI